MITKIQKQIWDWPYHHPSQPSLKVASKKVRSEEQRCREAAPFLSLDFSLLGTYLFFVALSFSRPPPLLPLVQKSRSHHHHAVTYSILLLPRSVHNQAPTISSVSPRGNYRVTGFSKVLGR
ncbi:hypothetical protein M434DRAFT_360420 [Hypoxylon sp. CO27-5]|nr:hypothetical protein M434DRAFT_360420 [Hypoxylon sp. CO27-5]